MNLYKQIKSLIPTSIKYPFWFIFKAPQRKISFFSLFTDLWGIVLFLYYKAFPVKTFKPISICTGIYNRSDNYLNRLLNSINKAKNNSLIELSVVDCSSDDIDNLELAIRNKWKGKLIFENHDATFSRSKTFNMAVRNANSSIVFICDADMSIPENIVELCNNYTGKKRAWYPICFFFFNKKPTTVHKENGIWEQYGGKGILACLKEDYIAIGGLNEQYTEWGYEDTELWLRFHQEKYIIIRNKQANLLHYWHNTHNPKYAHMNSYE